MHPQMPPAEYFLPAAAESTKRTPPKPMVQESFPRLKRRLYRPPFAPRIGLCKIYAVLSYRLCVPIRDALCACAGLAKQGKPLRLLRGGVRARRPTQSQELDSVGADDPVAVPKISMLPCGCRMKFRPRPLVHLASSATSGARFAPHIGPTASTFCFCL